MITRELLPKADAMLQKYPLIAVTGPRQSGKTTFCKQLRPDYQYLNMELPENREFAERDPHHFLQTYQGGVILDEVQNVPTLFSYLQYYTDTRGKTGEYILSGSQNFLLLEKITQSLAGRIAIFHLLPFSLHELESAHLLGQMWEEHLVSGFYPRLYDKQLSPPEFYPDYILTYAERDVRQVINVQDLGQFQQFMRLCAGRTGQLVNLSQMGNEIGLDQRTVRNWLSILEASFIVYLLRPFHRNFEKRVVKTPKLYFYDTGLASWLLGIRAQQDLDVHFARGSLFENFVINEMLKNHWNQGIKPDLYFWRDSNANEIDLLIENGLQLDAIEIKAGKTIQSDFFKNLDRFQQVSNQLARPWVVYGGDQMQQRSQATVLDWRRLGKVMERL
ncbi:MAG: ATP-binding protein [Saprospiraceae bacterium]|jgi:predicted AAA+ superfamily ATPase|nr:ATP-binding protein [Saprospiraceae bacterium]